LTQAIEKIINFITTTVHPKNAVKLDLSEEQLRVFLDSALSDTESIRKHLISVLFNYHTESEIKVLVQNYQSLIIRLLDDLFTYQECSKVSNNLKVLYSSLTELLANVLNYINIYFSKYFNFNEEVPAVYYLSHSKNFQEQISMMATQLRDRPADLKLIAIITSHYLVHEGGLNKQHFTFRNLVYRKALEKELIGLVSETTSHKTVCEVLLYVNFNHIEFFKYLIDTLQEECNKLQPLHSKLELLKFRRKLFRQTHIKENYALFSKLPSIKEQVVNWIDEEIIFLVSQMKLADHLPEKKDFGLVSEPKIEVTLSVAQLAFLIRIFNLSKIITNRNQSDVVRIFASNFKTSKTEEISYGSLYGKYYKAEPSTIKEVKSVLLQLVGLINKMKE
jgi:hypothetical protein